MEEIKNMIISMAVSAKKKLPENYFMDLEDLIQEGWFVYSKMEKVRFKCGMAKFSTLLYSALRNHYWKLLRHSYSKKRGFKNTFHDEIDYKSAADDGTPLDHLLEKEKLLLLAKFDEDIASIFVNGPSEELMRYLISSARVNSWKRKSRTRDSKKLNLDRICKFYGTTIYKLRRFIENGV